MGADTVTALDLAAIAILVIATLQLIAKVLL
jgi:hypothetical protein